MKKILCFLIVLFILLPAAPHSLQAYDTRRTDKGVFARILQAEKRGWLNWIGVPAEIVRTPVAQSKSHRWTWPVTMVPSLVTNVFIRLTSGLYDVVASPLVLPFTNDMTPLTEAMGLPDYPWQIKTEGF